MRPKEMKCIRKGITNEELLSYVGGNAQLVVECGCQDGRDTVRFLELFPQAQIVCFEPDPRPLERINPPGFLARIGDHPKVRLERSAVSDKEGTATLYRSAGNPPHAPLPKGVDWDASSSLAKPSEHIKRHPWCRFPPDKRIEVKTSTLDLWYYLLGNMVCDLLWVDVQGGQRALILGGAQFLARTRWIYIECHCVPMYAGEPTQDELVKMFAPLQFTPVALYENYNFLFRNEVENYG